MKIVVSIVGIMLFVATLSVSVNHYAIRDEEKELMGLSMDIIKPKQGYLYINDREIIPLIFATLIIGPITFEVDAESDVPIQKVEFYMNEEIKHTDYYPPYTWRCDEILFSHSKFVAKAYDHAEKSAEKQLSAWIFNKRSLPDAPPSPCIVEPSNSWTLFDPKWESIVVCDENVVVRAVELNLAEDVVSTLFEYSSDKMNWHVIGVDEFPGFEGIFLPGNGVHIGDNGWSAMWNLSGLDEGFYYVRATMTDESGQRGEHIKKIYYDKSPPIPEILVPDFEASVNGIIKILSKSSAEDIVSMRLIMHSLQHTLLQGGGAWYNQSTGSFSTNDLPADCPWRGGPCCPIAATNALAGQEDDRLYPNGKVDNLAMANMLAKKMKTTNEGTNAFEKTKDTKNYDIYEPDNVGSAINDYLAELNLNCSNPTGYTVEVYGIKMNSSGGAVHPVPGSSTVNFEEYSRAIREGQAVILVWMDWKAGKDGKWGTPDDTVGGSHAIAGRGCGNSATNRGQATDHPFSYTDVDGVSRVQGWRDYDGAYGGFSVLQGANTWNLLVAAMYVICPKSSTGVPLDEGTYISSNNTWLATWDTSTTNDGFYTLIVEMEDANGFVGRTSIVIEVNNTQTDETPPVVKITSPENNSIVTIPSINVTGYATDKESGIVEMTYTWEWDGGSAEDNKTYSPAVDNISFLIHIDALKEGWNKIGAMAKDKAGNTGAHSIMIFYEPEGEDNTPPITVKEVGMPNWEDGYVVANYTPIWLNSTDDKSGVAYIYYEVWWDSNENGLIDGDEMVGNEIVYSDTVKIYFGDWGVTNLVMLCWYSVDNAGNAEVIHCQEHFVIA